MKETLNNTKEQTMGKRDKQNDGPVVYADVHVVNMDEHYTVYHERETVDLTYPNGASGLYKGYIEQYGRVQASTNYETPVGDVEKVGWTFVKRQKYDDSKDTYLQKTWICFHMESTVVSWDKESKARVTTLVNRALPVAELRKLFEAEARKQQTIKVEDALAKVDGWKFLPGGDGNEQHALDRIEWAKGKFTTLTVDRRAVPIGNFEWRVRARGDSFRAEGRVKSESQEVAA